MDTSGGKAINISGGSLQRPVDVVPSHWYDSVAYQISEEEHQRGVTILNKTIPETVDNFPFLHIYKIEGRDASVFGSLKKAIRLCKHVKADASEEGRNISLSSFDIASAMYYADQAALRSGLTHELAILAETQRHLDYLTCNEGYAKTLIVPDGSRTIFNDNDKLTGLRRLSIEIDDLTREVAKEQNSILRLYDQPSLQESRSALSTAYIPGF